MTFVQLIDCRTDRVDDLNRLMDEWVGMTQGKRTATHSLVGRDRADARHCVEIVEFPSYEEAMKNAQLAETNRIFQEIVELCETPPTFTDLDVVWDQQLNKASVRRFFEEIAQGNLDAINEVYAADYQDHSPSHPSGDLTGTDQLRQHVEAFLSAFDARFTIHDQVAEGDKVSTRWSWSGTHRRGEFRGVPASGKQVTASGFSLHRFEGNLIKEGWWNWDYQGLLRQIGAAGA